MSAYSQLVLSHPNLVAYWQLNETQGSTAVEAKGGRDGFYFGGCALNRTGPTPYLTASVFFDGSTAFVEVPSDDPMHPGRNATPQTYSIELWLKYAVPPAPSSVPVPTLAGLSGTIRNISGTGLSYTSLGLWLQETASGSPAQDLAWHYLVETWDGTTIRRSLDGVQIASFVPSPGSWPPHVLDAYPFVMGGYGQDSNPLGIPLDPAFNPTGYFLNGYLSNVAFYNAALTPLSVANHWNAAFTSDPTPHAVSAAASIVFAPTPDGVVARHQANVTQVVAEVVRGQMDGFAYVTQLVVETVRPFVAGSTNTFTADASASIVFGAVSAAKRAFTKAATASFVFTARANAFHGLYKQATASIVFLATAVLDASARGSQAVARIIFRARTKNRFLPIVFGDDYLGRFQLGSDVPLWDLVRDQHGKPTLPTVQSPEARVYNLDTGKLLETLDLARMKGSRSGSVYARALTLGPIYQAGRHAVTYRAPTGGFTGYNVAIFEVVAGGDVSGPVIASHSFPAAGGDQILAQLGSGALAKGSRPRIG